MMTTPERAARSFKEGAGSGETARIACWMVSHRQKTTPFMQNYASAKGFSIGSAGQKGSAERSLSTEHMTCDGHGLIHSLLW